MPVPFCFDRRFVSRCLAFLSLIIALSPLKQSLLMFPSRLLPITLALVLGAQVMSATTEKPMIALQTPVAGSRISEGAVVLKGAVNDNQSVIDFKYALNNSGLIAVPGAEQPAKNIAFDTPIAPKPGLNELYVQASDQDGNTTQIRRTFTYVVKRPLTLTIASAIGDGSVTISPSEPLNALEVEKTYTLTAKPSAGYVFQQWSGTNIHSSSTTSLKFTMKEGMAITATFLPDPFTPAIVGEYNGLITADSGVTPGHGTNGTIKINVTSKGTFTGTVRAGNVTQSVSGFVSTNSLSNIFALSRSLPAGELIFDQPPPPPPDPFSLGDTTHFLIWLPILPDNTDPDLSIQRPDKPPLVLNLKLDLDPTGTHKITGTLAEKTPTGSTPMSVIEADRAAFDGKTPATTTVAATYTCALLPSSVNAQTPQGSGIGTITVTKDGKLSFVGSLADGTAMTSTMPLSAARTAPLYALLYGSRGAFGAMVALDESQPNSDVSSASSWWFRPFITGNVLPQGWPEGLSPQLVGAKYAVPAGESVLRGLDPVPNPNATLSFAEGGLVAPISKALKLAKTNAITKLDTKDTSFTATLTAATGKLTGSFTHSNGKKTTYNAIVLQKGANRGAFGYFVGSSLAGDAKLTYTLLPRPTVAITELMAKNDTSITDEDGAHSDWIELYNPGASAIDLTDWCLTDNPTNLAKWRFPAVTLNSKEFLIVWASAKNRRVPGSPLHTNFSLDANGEYLALVRPDGVTIEQEFAPTFPALRDDESYGVNFIGATLAVQGAAARYLVPSNASLGTTWTTTNFNDSSWRSGKTGIGFGMTVPGMTVRVVGAKDSFGGLSTLAQATALANLPTGHANIRQEDTRIRASLNLLGEGGDGHYDNNEPVPLTNLDRYVVHATGIIQIPTAGSYVFGLNSDDGGRIKIDGNDVMVDDTEHGPDDHLGAPVTLSAGAHTFDVIMWEDGGGDEVEFFASHSTATSWDDSFKLVGGPGGLAVFTTPLSGSAVSGSVATNVQSLMLNKNASCYVRVPFTASDVATLSGLTLNMRNNDGFVAYLNGTEIARRNAPAMPALDSAASETRSIIDSLTTESIDVSSYRSLLVNGKNVLAVHGMNDSKSDTAFLVLPELLGNGVLRSSTAVRFGPKDAALTATPGAPNGVPQFAGRVVDTSFSVKRGVYTSPFALVITSPTPGAQVRYTLDGSTPSATKGTLYTKPLTISRTSIVRAIAFKAGWEPTNVDTHSYFFFSDVIQQQASGTRPSSAWAADGVNGQAASYGMDPQVVNSSNANIGGAAKVKEALAALPTVSLVTDLPNLFSATTGIYVNPGGRGFDWERPASLEMIGDKLNASGGFHANCGVRIRGGFSRDPSNPKHSFHIYFRTEYGDASLKYALFGSAGAGSYSQIDLRTAQNYSWSFGADGNNTFMREEMARELQLSMGQPGSRDRYFHLYINGVYWGVYDFDERTEASFASTYLGGNKSDYDVVKAEQDSGYVTGVTDGNLDAWTQLWNKAEAFKADPSNANYFALQGKAADGVTPTTDPVLLDVDNLIDYMLLTFWTGNLDGCTSAFLGEQRANNWFGARDRTGTTGFKFFVHDFEHTFFNYDEDRTGPFTVEADSYNLTNSNPMWIHHDLRGNAEYRMRWADRVQKHMFNGGALVAETVLPRFQRRRADLDKAIIAESARWGDAKRAATEPPLTREDWLNAVSYLTDTYVPQRGSRVLSQLRTDGLYPSVDAPTLSQFGGDLPTGKEVSITGHGGTVYLTVDGSDPRQIGGTVNPAAQIYTSATSTETLIPTSQTWKYLADGSDQGTAWRAGAFDDSAWLSGAAELGYGDGDEATVVPFVDTDAVTSGVQKNATTYFRSSFTVSNVSELTGATISLKYDDAAIVYVNGVEAVRTDNISSNAAYNQFASSAVADENAVTTFSISPSLLVNGANSIAVEIHQASAESSDISFQLSLSVTRTSTPSPLFFNTAGPHRLQVRALNGSDWSALMDATFDVFTAPDMKIVCTPNGTFNVGDTGRTLTIDVSNIGTASHTNATNVTLWLPAGFTATSVAGTGWTAGSLSGRFIHIDRYDGLAAGEAFPPITVTLSIGSNSLNQARFEAWLSVNDFNIANDRSVVTVPVYGQGTQELVWAAQDGGGTPDRFAEEDGMVSVALHRRGFIAGIASVKVSTVNGTAKAPSDFDAITNQVFTFADGETVKMIDINLKTDRVREGNEHFSLVLSDPTNATIFNATNDVTILDPDATAPSVSIVSPAAGTKLFAVANGGTVNFYLKASDNFEVARVECSINGGAFTTAEFAVGGFPEVPSAKWRFSPVVNQGINTLAVRSVDHRGNVSSVITRTFEVGLGVGLQIVVQPDASAGRVTVSPALPSPGLAESGRTYTLKATVAAGYRFDHWSGPSINSEDAQLIVTPSSDMTVSAVFVPNPFVAAIVGDYNGLIRNDASVVASNANNGFINVKPTSTGAFTGTLKIDGDVLPLVGQFKNDGTCTFSVNRNSKTPLQLTLAIDLNPLGTHKITGSLSDVTRDATTLIGNLSADRAYFDGKTPATTLTVAPANLTIAALPTNTLHPPGPGSAKLTATRAGIVTVAGKLADTTSFTMSGVANQQRSAPLFTALYNKRGSLSGPVSIGSGATPAITGSLLWVCPVQNTTTYPFGWPDGVTVTLQRTGP